MKRHIRPGRLSCRLLLLLSSAFAPLAMGQTPPLCPPGIEEQDYGTGCSNQSVILRAGVVAPFNIGATKLSAAERTALFAVANNTRTTIADYLNNPTQFHRLAAGEDYANTTEWSQWYSTRKNALINARFQYWAIYASSQQLPESER